MPGKTRSYYWDSCVFLSWLKDEARPPGDMEGIVECVAAFEKGSAQIVTSSLVFAEVTRAKIPADVVDRFEALLRRGNATVIDINKKIGRLAGELKDYYAARADEYNGKRLSTPDALHLATAILYVVDEFHTFDKNNTGGTLGLIPLSGDVAGHKLAIVKPAAGAQIQMDLRGSAFEQKQETPDESETEPEA